MSTPPTTGKTAPMSDTEDRDFYDAYVRANSGHYPYEVPKPGQPQCEADGTREDTYGGEHYWSCTAPGTVDVDGTLMCEDHAGEQGYGPKQEDYGFDPDDGLNPTPAGGASRCDKALDTPSEVCPRCFRQHTWLMKD